MIETFYTTMETFYTMKETLYVCLEHFMYTSNIYVFLEHIIWYTKYHVGEKSLWCPMNYFKDDELNYFYVINFISCY